MTSRLDAQFFVCADPQAEEVPKGLGDGLRQCASILYHAGLQK